MTTDRSEAIRFMKIVLDWTSPQVARSMMDDLKFYIGDVTENDSIKSSIDMVRDMVYARAEENMVDDEDCGATECCKAPYKDTEQGLPADYQLDN